MTDIRNNILQNLHLWDRTLQDLLAQERSPSESTHTHDGMVDGIVKVFDLDAYLPDSVASSKVVLYGRHIWHCLHVLLFGTMDIVQMYRDLDWQSSSDFVQAGEHAISCAKVLPNDPSSTSF